MGKRMTVKQTAKEFFNGNVSEGLLYRLIKEDKIPHVHMASGKILLDSDYLERWWDNQIVQSMQEPVQSKGLRKIAE